MSDLNTLPIEGLPVSSGSVIITGKKAAVRLENLGLDQTIIENSLMAGHNGAQLATSAHARTAAGTYRWHETLAALRDALMRQNWELVDERNAPRIINSDSKTSIMVATGNAKTGTKQTPSNATPKGVMTEKDVWNNQKSEEQMIEGLEELLAQDQPVTWVLLYFYSSKHNHIRAELSRPAGFDKGFIQGWDERIILPPLSFDEEQRLPDAQPDLTPEIDFLIGDAEAS